MNRADQRTFHYIYKTTRFDGKYYIGLHSTDDLDDGYLGSGTKLWNSIRRHGKDKHVREILEFLPSRLALRRREREIVNEELLNDPLCMNLSLGGQALDHTDEVRRKISEKKKDIPLSEEHKRKVSQALKGKKKPEGFGEKIRNSLKGRKLSEQHKEKVRAAQIGRKLSPAHVAAQNAGKLGKKHSEERNKRKGERMKGKPNLSGSKLQKKCTIDGIVIYPSVSEFVKALGNGKKGIKHPDFRFLED